MALLLWLGLVTGREYDQKQWANLNISALATSDQDQQSCTNIKKKGIFIGFDQRSSRMDIQRLYICIYCA